MTRTLDGNPLASPLTGAEQLAGIQYDADVTIPLSALIALLSGSVADATAVVKGKIKLAGDLAGTADAPTVPGLSLKADANAVVALTGAQTKTGVLTLSSAPVVPDGSFTPAKTTGLQTALDGKAKVAEIGRRSVNAWNRYAGLSNGALPATTESGHAWTFYGQTPAVLGGKKRNPTGSVGPTYDSVVLPGEFASMAVEWTIEASGTLAGSSITLISSSTTSGALLQNFLHLSAEAGTGWGLSYVVGTLSGGNPLVFLATGPFAKAALGGRYRMELAVSGDLIYVRGPDGDITAVDVAGTAHTAAVTMAGPRVAWEIIAPTGVAEARIVAESAAVHDPAAVMAPPRDALDLARWIALHDSSVGINAGNLIAKKGDADEVEIGRSTATGQPSIRLGLGGPEWYESGGGISTLAGVMMAQGTANQTWVTSAGIILGTAFDTNLYRSAANTLATDDDLKLAGAGKALRLTAPDGTGYPLTAANGAVLHFNGVAVGGSTPDADATTKGKLQLAGDLGGTAASPTVPALALKADKAWRATVRKSADEIVNNSTTFQDDDHLLFPVGAGQTWVGRIIVFHSGDSTADIKFAVTFPASSTILVTAQVQHASTTAIHSLGFVTTSGAPIGSSGNSAGGSSTEILFSVVTTNAGNVTLQWAQNVLTVADTTVKAGSFLTADRIA